MHLDEKRALLDASLLRAAEQMGDITGPVFELYYSRFPHARQRFDELSDGNRGQLEGQMVEQVLYCLMTLLDCPGEIEFTLRDSVPHHSNELKVAPHWYTGLIDAVFDVLGSSIPPDDAGGLAVWNELRTQMRAYTAQGVSFALADAIKREAR